MDQSFFNIFDPFTDAVIICRSGVIIYANSSAQRLFATSPVGRDARALFGMLAGSSGSRSGTVIIEGALHTVNVSQVDSFEIYRIDFSDTTEDLRNLADAFSAGLRNASVQQRFASDIIRPYIGGIDDRQFLDCIAIHEHNSYRIARDAENIALLGSLGEWDGFVYSEYFDAVAAVASLIKSLPAFIRDKCILLDSSAIDYAFVKGDTADLERILLNLISNAVKYSPADSQVQIHLTKTDTHLHIRISDQGRGIAPERMAHVFDAWSQPHPTNDPKAGLGLGLHVARQLAERFLGTLMIESAPGNGTAATLSLPIPEGNFLVLREKQARYNNAFSRVLVDLADILPSDSYRSRYLD